jgi:hypothetical protein
MPAIRPELCSLGDRQPPAGEAGLRRHCELPLGAVSPAALVRRLALVWRAAGAAHHHAVCLHELGRLRAAVGLILYSSARVAFDVERVRSPCCLFARCFSERFRHHPSMARLCPGAATLSVRRAHSSSGLGHRPLTAAARVRIPYAPFYCSWLGQNRMVTRIRCAREAGNARAVPTWVPTSEFLQPWQRGSAAARPPRPVARARSRPAPSASSVATEAREAPRRTSRGRGRWRKSRVLPSNAPDARTKCRNRSRARGTLSRSP